MPEMCLGMHTRKVIEGWMCDSTNTVQCSRQTPKWWTYRYKCKILSSCLCLKTSTIFTVTEGGRQGALCTCPNARAEKVSGSCIRVFAYFFQLRAWNIFVILREKKCRYDFRIFKNGAAVGGCKAILKKKN